VGAEEEDGVLVRWGFHSAVRDVIDLKGNPKQEVVRESGLSTSSARHVSPGVGLWHPHPLGGKHGKQAPGWGPCYGQESHCGVGARRDL